MEGYLDVGPASLLPQGRELEANRGPSRRKRRQRQGGQVPLEARTFRSRGFQERNPPRAITSSRGNPQGLEHPVLEMPAAKEGLLRPGLTLEEVTKALELPEANEELRQQGTALPDKMNEAKEELPPQGTETEDLTSNPQPHLNKERTPTPNPTGTCQELLTPPITRPERKDESTPSEVKEEPGR